MSEDPLFSDKPLVAHEGQRQHEDSGADAPSNPTEANFRNQVQHNTLRLKCHFSKHADHMNYSLHS